MKKILVVNVNWLGDVLFSTPIFKALKKAYPDSHIACMLVPRVKEVLEGNPYVDEIIVFDEKGREKSLFGKIRFIAELEKKKFDTAFLLHRSFTRGLMVYLAGIAERVGYYTRKRGFLLTRPIPVPNMDTHRMDYYLNLVEAYGVKVEDRNYEFFIDDSHYDFIAALLQENGVKKEDFLAVLNPGANWELKRWPRERFARLADALIDEFKAKVVISGAQKDLYLAKEIASLMRNKPLILAGQTDLKQLGALFTRADLVVSADSGPMHIACAVGSDAVVIFGPTAKQITGPRGTNRCIIIQRSVGECELPCYKLDCPDNRCMKDISAEDVLKEIRKLRNR